VIWNKIVSRQTTINREAHNNSILHQLPPSETSTPTPQAPVMEFQSTVTDIVNELIAAHKSNKDVNLNSLRAEVSKRYKLKSQPRLVDIIAGIPEQYKPVLLPKLRAKPVRTASGVSSDAY
jgi:elongator complex protein 3